MICIISKEPQGEYAVHDIQTCTAWGSNPNPTDYAIVPLDMVEDIMSTCGFVDIVLNDDGTEVVSFTALPIPEIPVPEAEPTLEERVSELEIYNADLLYQVCLLQLGLTEDDL